MRATYILYLVDASGGRFWRVRELDRFDDAAAAWKKHDVLLNAGVDVEVSATLDSGVTK
jgi:hypothetical protein